MVGLLAAACQDGGGADPLVLSATPAWGEAGVRLVASSGCFDVGERLREAAIADMSRRLKGVVRQYLTDDGTACRPFEIIDKCSVDDNCADYGVEEPAESTGTNNQTAGVDEADFVKHDGKYIYLLANGAFRIIEAWPAESAREVASVALEGEGKKLFVEGDRALVYSSPGEGGGAPECTYGYDCEVVGDGRPTDITIYDVSDRAAPRVVRRVRASSSLVAARRVGDAVHTVLHAPGGRFDAVRYDRPEGGAAACQTRADVARLREHFEAVRRRNEAAIRATPLADLLPSVSDGGADALAACPGFYRGARLDPDDGFTTVLSLSLADDASPLRSSTVISRPGVTYASGEALYVTVPPARGAYDAAGTWRAATEERSVVHRFDLAGGAAKYVASGAVEGRVLNQFALDERDGYLRVATTVGHLPSPDARNALTVLARRGPDLEAVGAVGNIAPGEDIRSVRFDGDRGYVVTFKKTDPLFVFDLADPRAPRVLGELKIPGFSTYMHRLDAGHLLTVGYDADDHGDFAYFDGVLLQIFDVRDPANPRLAHKEVIGTRGSSSEALTNHLAFTYFPERGLLALPMSICDGGDDGEYGEFSFGGVLVYDVSAEAGFAPRGRVDFGRPDDEELADWGRGGDECSNWWTNSSSAVKRTIFLDDVLYSVADGSIKVSRVDDLSTDVASIDVSKAPGGELGRVGAPPARGAGRRQREAGGGWSLTGGASPLPRAT